MIGWVGETSDHWVVGGLACFCFDFVLFKQSPRKRAAAPPLLTGNRASSGQPSVVAWSTEEGGLLLSRCASSSSLSLWAWSLSGRGLELVAVVSSGSAEKARPVLYSGRL